jgi:hypothetical protein
MSEQPDMRLSDRDRDAISERLRDALAEGRLERTEFDERLGRVLRAKTYGEVQDLTRDLPLPVSVPQRARWSASSHLRRAIGSLGVVWGIWAVVLVTGGGAQGWWPLYVTVPWAVSRLAHPGRVRRRLGEEITEGGS